MLESAKEGVTGLSEGSDIGLGPGDRAFEPHYSDQNPSEIVDFRGIFLFFVYCGAEFKNGPLIYFVVPLYQLYLLIRKPTDFSVVILQKIDIIFMEVFEAHSCLTHCSGERV